jgi:hypothetical protein
MGSWAWHPRRGRARGCLRGDEGLGERRLDRCEPPAAFGSAVDDVQAGLHPAGGRGVSHVTEALGEAVDQAGNGLPPVVARIGGDARAGRPGEEERITGLGESPRSTKARAGQSAEQRPERGPGNRSPVKSNEASSEPESVVVSPSQDRIPRGGHRELDGPGLVREGIDPGPEDPGKRCGPGQAPATVEFGSTRIGFGHGGADCKSQAISIDRKIR